ncbi:peptidoglycan-binding protein LysM [Streptomyces sp. NPDC086989]|uniref:peptidoglycan-binding protein LysM n=1 Tax=Streptomyces sp. NPDC086989 TaxID=3365764 RepID=UPI0037FE7DD9
MGEIWIPEAERLGDGVIAGAGAMDTPNAPPRVVWHTTEGSAGSSAAFHGTADYLMEENYEPHILYDPITDQLGQFGPLNQSAKALVNAGAVRTNRTGRVCIQIEVMAKAGAPFTGYWKPGPNFAALLRAIRSWGVPDEWPAGRLAQSYSDDSPRPLTIWQTRGGHYGHSNIPGNDHWDPGAIDTTALLAAGTTEEQFMTPDDRNYLERWFGALNAMAWGNKNDLAALTGTVAALTKLVAAADNNLDEATVRAAVKQGVTEALAASTVDVDVTVHDKTTTPKG